MKNQPIESITQEKNLSPVELYNLSRACFNNALAERNKSELKKGEALLIQAAETNYFPAITYLAALYYDGRLLGQNLVESKKWADKADKEASASSEQN